MSTRERDQELEDFETGVVARIKEERLARRMSQVDLALDAFIQQLYVSHHSTHTPHHSDGTFSRERSSTYMVQ